MNILRTSLLLRPARFYGLVLFLTENILDIIDGFTPNVNVSPFSYVKPFFGILSSNMDVRRIHGLDIQPGIKRNAVREKFHVLKRKLKYVCL
jgi:hypothetical protein